MPIYNVEKYLEDCIESIIKQGVESSEIILVDDGSTDGSAAICDRYAEFYMNINVIHKQNGGISSARNIGLKAAQGEYICFVDSDDFFEENFADKFLNICEKYSLDIIRGWYAIYDEETKEYQEHKFPDISYANKVLPGYEFLKRSINEHANEVVPWLGFFKREYLTKHNLLFPEGIAYEEDQLFFLEALICDQKCRIYQSDLEFYAYRKRVGSATKTPTLKQVQDVIYVVEKENMLLKKYSLSSNVKKAVKRYICSSFYQLTSIYGRINIQNRKKTVRMIPFWMKWQCIWNAYDYHQRLKIFLFTFARWLVDTVYKKRGL